MNRPDERGLRAVGNLGAGQELAGVVAIPPSLFAPRLHCPCCLSDERDGAGDALDLLHAPGCELAGELAAQRAVDLAELAARAERGEAPVLTRTTTEAEVDLHETQNVDATDQLVVVQPTEAGGRRRWWPHLADDVS